MLRQSAAIGECLIARDSHCVTAAWRPQVRRFERVLCYLLPMRAQKYGLLASVWGLRAVMVLVFTASAAVAGPIEDVGEATRAWGAAYDSRDPKRILSVYAPDAVFWGTSSPTLRDTPASIGEYFANASSQPNARVEIGAFKVRVWGETAASTGSYTFTDVRNGETVRRPARFSFVFRLVGGRWLIVDHHSSAVPAAPAPPR
jgi:uncharacterized protein (TIGR02246 family)